MVIFTMWPTFTVSQCCLGLQCGLGKQFDQVYSVAYRWTVWHARFTVWPMFYCGIDLQCRPRVTVGLWWYFIKHGSIQRCVFWCVWHLTITGFIIVLWKNSSPFDAEKRKGCRFSRNFYSLFPVIRWVQSCSIFYNISIRS